MVRPHRIYISGPMTGIENHNREEFQKYEDLIRSKGFRNVINPHKIHSEYQTKNFTWEQFLRSDIKVLMDCDLVVLIPGWENSKGAQLENHVAYNTGIKIIHIDKFLEINFDFQLI